jgi:hypothetical protein
LLKISDDPLIRPTDVITVDRDEVSGAPFVDEPGTISIELPSERSYLLGKR